MYCLGYYCYCSILSHVQLFETPSTAARLPGPCSNSSLLSQWCHPTISSSATTFSSCPQSFPESGYFLMSLLFGSGARSIGASASASLLPMNIQVWFPLGWTSLISLLSKGLWRVFSYTTVQKHQFFGTQPSLWSNSHTYTATGKILKMTCLSETQTKLNVQHTIWQPSSGKTLPSLGDLCNFRADKLRIHPLLISRKSDQITHVSFKAKARFRSRN